MNVLIGVSPSIFIDLSTLPEDLDTDEDEAPDEPKQTTTTGAPLSGSF